MKKLLLSLTAIAALSLGASADVVTDVLNNANTVKNEKSSTYGEYTVVGENSGATYYLQCAGSNNSIQLRSNNNNSGVVVTKSVGTVKSISVSFVETTLAGRTLNVYASNVAYKNAADLYASDLEPITTFVYSEDTDTYTYTFEQDYSFVGVRSASSALYLNDIQITWDTDGTVPEQPEQPEEPGDETTIYSETFANGGGEFTIVNDELPEGLSYVWSFDSSYHYAKASAYVGGTRYAVESWLVSPAIDLGSKTGVVFSFDHAANYLSGNDFDEFLKVYVGEANTDKSTWADVTSEINAASGNSWTFVNSGNVELTAFEGKSIQVAFVYSATEEVAPTWEVKNFVVEVAVAEDDNAKGSETNPYTVQEVIANGTSTTLSGKYVAGYIVGYVNGMSITEETAVFSNQPATEDGEVSKTNLLLADYDTCKDYTECIPVQLPAGSVRNALNLAENPSLLGAQVLLYGSIEKYFSVPGLKSVTKYTILKESGIEEVEMNDENSPVEFFNLQGVRVANPENGLFIRRQGNNVSKVVIK